MQTFWTKIHPSKPLVNLIWWDCLVLSVIFFGEAIWISTQEWLAQGGGQAEPYEFTASDNWQALLGQGWLLILALLYLWIRHYDFRQLQVKLEWSLLWKPIVIFIGAALVCDVSFALAALIPGVQVDVNPWLYLPYLSFSPMTLLDNLTRVDFSTVVYSLFNGFYEEFFFLGLLLSTSIKSRRLVLLWSTLIRIAFHTYQGLVPALVIGVSFGLFYYWVYTRKTQNLLQFSLAHAFADMVGINLFLLFLPI